MSPLLSPAELPPRYYFTLPPDGKSGTGNLAGVRDVPRRAAETEQSSGGYFAHRHAGGRFGACPRIRGSAARSTPPPHSRINASIRSSNASARASIGA